MQFIVDKRINEFSQRFYYVLLNFRQLCVTPWLTLIS